MSIKSRVALGFIALAFSLLAAVPAKAWWALAYLVVVGSIVAFTAFVWLTRHAPLSLVAIVGRVDVAAIFLNPLIPLDGRHLGLLCGVAVFQFEDVLGRSRFAKGRSAPRGTASFYKNRLFPRASPLSFPFLLTDIRLDVASVLRVDVSSDIRVDVSCSRLDGSNRVL